MCFPSLLCPILSGCTPMMDLIKVTLIVEAVREWNNKKKVRQSHLQGYEPTILRLQGVCSTAELQPRPIHLKPSTCETSTEKISFIFFLRSELDSERRTETILKLIEIWKINGTSDFFYLNFDRTGDVIVETLPLGLFTAFHPIHFPTLSSYHSFPH